MPFEEFDKRAALSNKSPTVTVLSTKGFTLNKAAYDLLGSPGAVTLLYDPDEHLVGFKPSGSDSPRAYKVRPQPKGPSVSVSGRSFIKHYGIDSSTTRRYEAQMSDGMLVLNLESESAEIAGPWKRRKESQEA